MPTIEVLQGIAGLGALGITLIGIWALGTGRVRVGFLVDRAMEQLIAIYEKRLAEQKEESDGWQDLAQAATPELKRLNDLLEVAVKLLLDRTPRP